MNPYASESANRMAVKSKPKNQDEKGVDHPLFDGKKMDVSEKELKNFTKALEKEEFRDILGDYVQEISNPENAPEYDAYLRQMEAQGDLPHGTHLIQPNEGFCIKATAKKLINQDKKKYFDQKMFVNICFHEEVERPSRELVTRGNERGYTWQLPYRVSKPRHDQDNNKELCSTVDVVFHPEVDSFIKKFAEQGQKDQFVQFVCDTALDGVNQVLAEAKESVSKDYKIMQKMKCKGAKPGLMTVKDQGKDTNKLLANLDASKHKTSMQKEIDKARQEYLTEEEKKAKENEKPTEIEEADESAEEDEPRPDKEVRPKFKIVHSYPVNLQDSFQNTMGENVDDREAMNKGQSLQKKIPTHLTVTINVPHLDSAKQAKLDFRDDNSLIFQVPNLYYLDTNLYYQVDPSQGSAKFDKTKKTMVVKVPVTGMTEESKKRLEADYKVYQDQLNERQKDLEPVEEKENQKPGQSLEQKSILEIEPEALQSKSKQGFFEQKQNLIQDQSGEDFKDKYNLESTDASRSQIDSQIEEQKQEDGSFLKVYKEEKNEEQQEEQQKLSEVKFTADQEENARQETPLVQEISSTENQPKQEEKEEEMFDWENADRVEFQPSFIERGELIFLNFNVKGYDTDKDCRYALSTNEILIEIRDPATQKVHKFCQTLFKEIDVAQSSIQLLVNFVSVQLKKDEKKLTWNQVGFSISDFSIPEVGQMKSNFLKSKPKLESKEEEEKEEEKEEEEKEEETKLDPEAEFEKKKEELLKRLEEERKKQICHLELENPSITQIF